MQKLLLISLTLISSQTLTMQPSTINARVSSAVAKLAGAKTTTHSIAAFNTTRSNSDKHLKYIHEHNAYLTQQLKDVMPLSATEIATRAVLLSDAIKRAGFLTWEQYEGAEKAYARHIELAAKSAMLDRKEIAAVVHACAKALAAEVPLFEHSRTIKYPFAPGFAIYPFRFGAGLKYYNHLHAAKSSDLR